jgi:hypothetical protein
VLWNKAYIVLEMPTPSTQPSLPWSSHWATTRTTATTTMMAAKAMIMLVAQPPVLEIARLPTRAAHVET